MMNETLIVTLTFATISSILSLLVGFGIGWLAHSHAIKSNPYHRDNLHPEMYDQHGNVVPDEILALRFEHGNVIPDEILALRFEHGDNISSTWTGGEFGEGNSSEWIEEEEDD